MKKRIIIPTAAIICAVLCATLWPQTAPMEEVPAPTPSTAVTAPLPTKQMEKEQPTPASAEDKR